MPSLFINTNKITQVANSNGTSTYPRGYPTYTSNTKTTLFWGMYRNEDINKCRNHIGKKSSYYTNYI